jgi:hypothetical protein
MEKNFLATHFKSETLFYDILQLSLLVIIHKLANVAVENTGIVIM